MKQINGTNYMATESVSGSMLFGTDLNEKIKEDYKTKNLNEKKCST